MSKGKKRINPETGKPFHYGDKREDGYIFFAYQQMIVNKKTGFYREIWLSEGSYKNANNFWNRVVTKTKERAKKKNLPHNIDKDYIQTIFPNDSKCPALGIEMEIADGNKSGKDNSPSLDRLVPEKGYVEGNVVWISLLANRIKNSATADEIEKVYKWLKKEIKK